MAGRIRRMKAEELEKLLGEHGFAQSGSHRKWRHGEKRLQVVVPAHKGKPLPIGRSPQF